MSFESDLTMLCMAARVDPVLRDALARIENEVTRLRRQAKALAAALEELQATVQATCEGGHVDMPGLEILGEELGECDVALRAYREANHE